MKTETQPQATTTHAAPTAGAAVQALIEKGLQAWEKGRYEDAQALMHRAAGADLRQPEGWYNLGSMKEETGDLRSAVYCYYLANDIRRYEPALEALRRLGYLNGH